MKLAILLTSGYEYQDKHTTLKIAEAALAEGHEVGVFLMEQGVYAASHLAGLTAQGANVFWCSHNAAQRGLPEVPGVQGGSQFDWATMASEADRVLSFG